MVVVTLEFFLERLLRVLRTHDCHCNDPPLSDTESRPPPAQEQLLLTNVYSLVPRLVQPEDTFWGPLEVRGMRGPGNVLQFLHVYSPWIWGNLLARGWLQHRGQHPRGTSHLLLSLLSEVSQSACKIQKLHFPSKKGYLLPPTFENGCFWGCSKSPALRGLLRIKPCHARLQTPHQPQIHRAWP